MLCPVPRIFLHLSPIHPFASRALRSCVSNLSLVATSDVWDMAKPPTTTQKQPSTWAPGHLSTWATHPAEHSTHSHTSRKRLGKLVRKVFLQNQMNEWISVWCGERIRNISPSLYSCKQSVTIFNVYLMCCDLEFNIFYISIFFWK